MDKLLSLQKKPAAAAATALALPTMVELFPEPQKLGPGTHKVHVWLKQMGKKWVTTIEDLDEDLDLVKISKYMKRTLNCAVDVVEDEKTGKQLIKIQGHKRDEVAEWIVANEVMTEKEAKERLVLHGV